jgi:hypothetical protein
MTALSEAMAPKICRFCANSTGTHCRASVPYYCVSIHCRRFTETPLPKKPLSDRTLMRRCLKALVETV